jgi:hypothetical protein
MALQRGWLAAAVLATLLLNTGSAARANFDFTFASTPTITAASANPAGTTNTITNGLTIGGLPGATFTSVATSGTSTITLTGRNTSTPLTASALGTNTKFLDVVVTSNDQATRNYSLNFDVAYTLTDPTPNGGPGPQVVHFLGKLTGFIDGRSPTSTNLSFSTVDFSPALNTGPTVTAGDGNFKVTLRSFNNPGLGAGAAGGLTARVFAVPEPSSMTLVGLGSLGALVLYRRRSQKATA